MCTKYGSFLALYPPPLRCNNLLFWPHSTNTLQCTHSMLARFIVTTITLTFTLTPHSHSHTHFVRIPCALVTTCDCLERYYVWLLCVCCHVTPCSPPCIPVYVCTMHAVLKDSNSYYVEFVCRLYYCHIVYVLALIIIVLHRLVQTIALTGTNAYHVIKY